MNKEASTIPPSRKPHVVVSMTSFPAAIEYAQKAVVSLLKGKVLPDKIVLYLTYSQFGSNGIPGSLLELANNCPLLEIRDYPEDIRSYRKLLPALKDFPDSVIVTVDDDVEYHPEMLAKLLEVHARFPHDVIAHRTKEMRPSLPYKKWKKHRWYNFLFKRIIRNPLTMQTGVAGVLYPPHALDPEIIGSELFKTIAPTTDDIWFWAATIANGRVVIPVPFGCNKPKSLGKPKALSLKCVNYKGGDDRNSRALANILSAFPQIKTRLPLQ
ncbi:MAG: glycosyltransferase [Muribaculaceae bacterium]|nr:glycosyltransferase [Muribaculaceae bacterium]